MSGTGADSGAGATDATPSPWVLASEPTSLGDPAGLITLVDGQTFCLSGRSGDFSGDPTHGVFFADMRVLSTARFLVGGSTVEPLAVELVDSSGANFVGRSRVSMPSEHRLVTVRRRALGSVWHERIELRNTGPFAVSTVAEFQVAADFADVFSVKEGRTETRGAHAVEVIEHGLMFEWRLDDVHRRAMLTLDRRDATITTRGFAWPVQLEPHETCIVRLDLTVAMQDEWVQRHHHHPSLPDAAGRSRSWLAKAPRLRTLDRKLGAAYDRSVADLGALRLHDPTGHHRAVIAAGAPWYMTLFGRDALISSFMALPIDPTLALGVLQALAELQGTDTDPITEEQPGRIMHETRYLGVRSAALMGGDTYYGSVDSTPLFVVLLGELARWGLPDDILAQLLPHADRAIDWMLHTGDRDGDGFVEYCTTSSRGLVNQGWKDSVDGIRYHDGRIASAPLALCEVQGYAYAALRARAAIAARLGKPDDEARHLRLATTLRERFNQQFWMEEHGWFAMALDADKQPVDALASNMGHCLWSGIVDDEHAGAVADRLMSPAMWNGWGIRTLASDEAAFDPMSYHCGTVWPHDGALAAAGLRAYGFEHAALQVANGLVDASAAWNGRLPELFSGLDRSDVGTPVPFPTSCSPQAWAAATPFLLLRTVLGIEPDDELGLTVDPIDGSFDDLTFTGIHRLDRRRFDVRVTDTGATVTEWVKGRER